MIGWILVGAAVAVAAVTVPVLRIRRRLVVVTVTGDSMLPTYRSGDRVVVRRTGLAGVLPGQVVVIAEPDRDGHFRAPPPTGPVGDGQWMIKRFVAGPGDPVPDGLRLPERDAAATRVPAAAFLVLGDNAARSFDSRQIGFLPADRLLGVVLRTMTAA